MDSLDVLGSFGPELKREDQVPVGGRVVDRRRSGGHSVRQPGGHDGGDANKWGSLWLVRVDPERAKQDPLGLERHQTRHLAI